MTPIDQIKERLNIIDVIGEYTALKRSGITTKGLCPFHSEKTPSFTVSDQKQLFHCFGCGKGGDIFTFIQEIEGVEFPEALRMLAQKAGVELRPTDRQEHNVRTELLDVLVLAQTYYHSTLLHDPAAVVAREYFEKRAMTPKTQEEFYLGYSLPQWNALTQNLMTRGIAGNVLERAGLAVRSSKTGEWYDRFRGRVMFPIHNPHGNVIGFGGRIIMDTQQEAKYINSPQTDVYNKSTVLYGLPYARSAIQKMDAVVIVEGYMDVLACHQAKFHNVVAASGTALTEEQIRLLKRYTQNVILAFDPDAAGLSATWRGMQLAIRAGINIKVMQLPRGEDPDEVIRRDPQAFRDAARLALPFMEYAFAIILSPLDMRDVLHKKKAAKELLPMITLFPDAIERAYYVQLLADKLDVDMSLLKQQMHSSPTPSMHPSLQRLAKISKDASPAPSHDTYLSNMLIAALVALPSEFPYVAQRINPEMLATSVIDLYKSFQVYHNQHGQLDTTAVLITDAFSKENQRYFQLLAEEEFGAIDRPEQQHMLVALVKRIERRWIYQELRRLEKEFEQLELLHGKEKEEVLTNLVQRHRTLLQRRLMLE